MSHVVQRSEARYVTRGAGWVGRYCFSYDGHYDPANVCFGRLLACNEFVLEPGAGFGLHRHAGVEIITTVLAGVLTSGQGTVRAGETRVLDATAGIEHDERNEGDVPVRFVQAFRLPGAGTRQFALVTAGPVPLGDLVLETGDSVRSDEPLAPLPSDQALVWDC